MRNPERMEPILAKLLAVWKLVPDWRLGQLIYNLAGRDPFYMEEKELEEKLDRFIKENIE